MSDHSAPYIVCFGEVLWDVYPDGKRLGGAPFNVAAHATQLSTPAHIISKVGHDDLGKEIIQAINDQGVSSAYTLVDPAYATGVVEVLLNEVGKPSYNIKNPSAWDYIHVDDRNKELVKKSQALVYGSLVCRNQTSRNTLFELIKLSKLKICDLNIRLAYYSENLVTALLQSADILKVNDEEALLLQEMFGIREDQFYPALSKMFSIDIIIQTLGEKGAEAYTKGCLYTAPGVKIKVVDTVGSGDAFLAAFLHYFLRKENLDTCLSNACKLGGYVATQSGAIPSYSQEQIFI